MSGWAATELDTIVEQDELTVASRRNDGSLTRPRVVWAVRVGDEVFVRSVNYARNIVDSICSAQARSTTLKLDPAS